MLGIVDLRNDNESRILGLHTRRRLAGDAGTPDFHIVLVKQDVPVLIRGIVNVCTLISTMKQENQRILFLRIIVDRDKEIVSHLHTMSVNKAMCKIGTRT